MAAEYYGELSKTFLFCWGFFVIGFGCFYAGVANSYCSADVVCNLLFREVHDMNGF